MFSQKTDPEVKNTFVSVIIPVRNEERYIEKCIQSILKQTYPKENLEVFLVDGRSEDRTREIIEEYTKRYPFIKLLDNPDRIVPTALNRGVKAAKGEIIIRMDAHTVYAEDYIEKCVETLKEVDADNVGGPIVTLPGDDTIIAKAIALATSHPFGVGNSKFRTSRKAEYVDTVTFGAFRRDVFQRVGFFDERLVRNQDIEFNYRIRRSGGKIFLNPAIKSFYYNQATLRGLWKQNFRNGMWNIFTTALTNSPLSLRHYIPFAFVSSLLVSLFLSFFRYEFFILFLSIVGLYVLTGLFFSIKIGLKTRIAYIPFLFASFLTLHLSYGFGSLSGLLKLKGFKRQGIYNTQ
jgi:glycosyltransferase involved in cell wall biosynthesis